MIGFCKKVIQLVIMFSFTACVSIDLKPKQRKVNDGVSFTSPTSPYREIQLESADHSWQNPNTGNTISYMSSCENYSDPDLESLLSIATEGIEGLRIVQQKKLNFNGREALNTILIGRVDGVPIQADLTVLKKNNCVFNISYIASVQTFMNDLPNFKKFFTALRIK